MIGDMGRYTQFEGAQSMPIASANESGGAAGVGVGLGAGLTMAQQMMSAMKPAPAGAAPQAAAPQAAAGQGPAAPPTADSTVCMSCGKPMPRQARFCPECGTAQG